MRIGIFGGTFDPVHLGHLRLAEEVRESFNLDEVRLIPCAQPPHKQSGPWAAPEQRLAMVELAVENAPGLAACDLEVRRGCVSFTVETLTQLSAPGSTLFFITGMDAFLEVHTWRRCAELFALADFIVVSRPGAAGSGLAALMQYASHNLPLSLEPPVENRIPIRGGAHGIRFFPCTALEISSTTIRGLVKNGRSARFLAPDKVLQFIHETGIYK